MMMNMLMGQWDLPVGHHHQDFEADADADADADIEGEGGGRQLDH